MNICMKKLCISSIAFVGILFSSLAFAHPGHELTVSFMSGLLHPFSGLDHLLVIVLVGFWSAFVLKKIWLGPCFFILGMFFGVLSGLSVLYLNFFEFGIATSVIAIGLLLLIKNQYSTKAILSLIGAFGVFHGYAHAELFSSASYGFPLITEDMAGLFLATGILHLSGAIAVQFLKDKTTIIARVTGFASVIYGWVLLSQLSFALLGGTSV